MAFDEGDWASFLSRELGFPVHVRFGRARNRVLEARPLTPSSADRAELDVRMSAFFGEAPLQVRAAVAHWLRVGRRARRSADLLDRWIAQSVVKLPPAPRRSRKLRATGRHHDLLALARELVDREDPLPRVGSLPGITWGRAAGSRPRHSLQLGSYVLEQNLIRVHPVLDREWVPGWFVQYVLFHELLHAALPPAVQNGRTIHHGPEFRRKERQYKDFARALTWQEKNLPHLLRDAHKREGRWIGSARTTPSVSALQDCVPRGAALPRAPGQGLLFSI